MDRKRYRRMRGSASTSAGDSTGFFPEEERAHEHLFQLGNDLKSTLSEIFSGQAAQREKVMKLKKINKRLLKSNQELKKKVMKLESEPGFGRNKTALANELDAPKRKYEVLEALRKQLKKKDAELDALKKELRQKNEVLLKDGNPDDDDDVQKWMKDRNADHDDEVMKERNADDDDDGVQEVMKEGNADDDDDGQEWMKEENADVDDDDDVQEVIKEGNADEDDAHEGKKVFISPSAKIDRAAFKEELKQILFQKSMSAKWHMLSLNDPHWQPFKTVPIEGSDEHEEILDLNNGRIAMLRLQLGDEADSLLWAAFHAAKNSHGQH